MSFDARSLERLRQLGRTLPQRLPPVEPPAPADQAAPAGAGDRPQRHRLETETDPGALFHELVRASADGTAPPHLLERLRQLETPRSRPEPARPGGGPERRHQPRRRDPQTAAEQAEDYTAFQQLLLEDDEL